MKAFFDEVVKSLKELLNILYTMIVLGFKKTKKNKDYLLSSLIKFLLLSDSALLYSDCMRFFKKLLIGIKLN